MTKNIQINEVEIKTILDTIQSWDQSDLPNDMRINIKEFTIQPGAKTVIHKHPVHGGGTILEGELTMFVTQDPHGSFDDSKKVKKVTLKSGETWAETIDTWHYGVNEGSIPVKFILTFIGDKDTPQTISL
jgi:quercetin dioxygenase-like cupin family protein